MRLHTYQAKSLDDIWLDDIPNIRNPAAAVQDLGYTASPERRIQEWDLPDGYSVYVNKYRVFHRQFTWMAYRDVLNDVRRGNVVLLKRHDSGDEMARVVTSSGALRGDLPVALHTRLSYLIRNQLHRPRYITGTINSKAAGRLLAAGGIYNGNPDGFRNTARQLGGDAPAGYDQVMDPRTKGLIIAGASILGIGRVTPARIQELEDIAGFSTSKLSDAAGVMDKAGLTKAGRALQKHGDRAGSIFPKAVGDTTARNTQGQGIVDGILNDSGSTVLQKNTGRFGLVTDIISPEGKGIRYDANGNFIGFLEPPK